MIIDFHSHILPNVDDGSRSVEESMAMLRMEAEQGIDKVVVTPHFYPRHDNLEQFLIRRDMSMARLQEEMYRHEEMPQVICGAEVYYFSGISNCEALPRLTIDGKRYILIEMPMVPWTAAMYAELEEISTRWGITPIIAHVDRYLSLFRTRGILERLEQMPVLVQANASFFLHGVLKHRALRMLARNQIHLLGSDCHNMSNRVPNLGGAQRVIAKHLPQDVLDRIRSYQCRVLDGK